jgi:hypothetical protein
MDCALAAELRTYPASVAQKRVDIYIAFPALADELQGCAPGAEAGLAAVALDTIASVRLSYYLVT